MSLLTLSDSHYYKYAIHVSQDEYDLLVHLLNKVEILDLSLDEEATLNNLLKIEVF